MVEHIQRMPVRAPTFIRLLTRLTDTAPLPPALSLADKLGQWIDWNRAVALSRALDGATPTPRADARPFDAEDETACARARATLVDSITDDAAWLAAMGKPADTPGDDAPHAAFAALQQRYIALQRAMQSATGKLRGQLRDRLSNTSAEMARLAEIDAAMELVLSPREHALLGNVPMLLARHFDRMRNDAPAMDDADADADAATTPPATFPTTAALRRDMQSLLLAELDLRFQPIEALLAALRA